MITHTRKHIDTQTRNLPPMNYKTIYLLLLSLFLFQCSNSENPSTQVSKINSNAESQKAAYAIAIHGGAGTITKKNMTPEKEKQYLTALNAALDIGENILKNGGSSMDAVEKTIHYMEDSPLFNAGKGAVFTNAETNELDASFMEGKNLNAGSVGGVSNIKNPISAARAVMEKSDHVLLTGKGAEIFAAAQGIETVESKYFFTQRRWDFLQKVKAEEAAEKEVSSEAKHGTVGCVALDKNGNLAAGTSTGGMTNKRWNRLGDSPIIGAGTYANNATCAVSCTGHGEYFIRYAVAHDISAMMEYKGASVQEAGDYVINDKLVKAQGEGGAICLDKNGNVAMPFNSEGMYRAYAKPSGREVLIYK